MTTEAPPPVQDLLPCPFCGEDRASYVNVSEPDNGYVHCLACDSSYGEILPFRQALKAWNTRAALDSTPAVDEETLLEAGLQAAKDQLDSLAFTNDEPEAVKAKLRMMFNFEAAVRAGIGTALKHLRTDTQEVGDEELTDIMYAAAYETGRGLEPNSMNAAIKALRSAGIELRRRK